jgi:hypothetical protein
MAVTAGAARATLCGSLLPKVWTAPLARSYFADLVLFAFLLAQGLDGFYTYTGVLAYGPHIEANPIVAALMGHLGEVAGLVSAKAVASLLGICLYLCEVHTVLALLTGFYLTAAIAPWTLILYF